jgi:hypothetical protein
MSVGLIEIEGKKEQMEGIHTRALQGANGYQIITEET